MENPERDYDLSPSHLSDAILAEMRTALEVDELVYNDEFKSLGAGMVNEVFSFSVKDGREGLGRHKIPLVARIPKKRALDETEKESAIHHAMVACGYPVPVVMAHGRILEDIPYVVMQRFSGHSGQQVFFLIGLIGLLTGLIDAYLINIPVPVFLTALTFFVFGWLFVMLRFHRLPVDKFRQFYSEEGQNPDELTLSGTINAIRDRCRDHSKLEPLVIGSNWLADNLPAHQKEVICHGDFHPGNFMLHWQSGFGVIDLSRLRIAPREFDISWFMMIGDMVAPPPLSKSPKEWIGLTLLKPLIWLMFWPPVIANLPFIDLQKIRYCQAVHALELLSMFRDPNNDISAPSLELRLAQRFKRITGVQLITTNQET